LHRRRVQAGQGDGSPSATGLANNDGLPRRNCRFLLLGLELNILVLSAALRGEPTGQPYGFRGDVAHGEIVRRIDVEFDANNETIKTRKAMEAAFAK